MQLLSFKRIKYRYSIYPIETVSVSDSSCSEVQDKSMCDHYKKKTRFKIKKVSSVFRDASGLIKYFIEVMAISILSLWLTV